MYYENLTQQYSSLLIRPGLFGCFAMDAKGSYSLIALTVLIKIYVAAAITTQNILDLA